MNFYLKWMKDLKVIKGQKIKENEKLANNIKVSIERGKAIDNENVWNDDNKLSLLLNDCINIEKNIEYINVINKHLSEINERNINLIRFVPEDQQEINNFLNIIKKFGDIESTDDNFLKKTNKNK